jgi:hypothetical protein
MSVPRHLATDGVGDVFLADSGNHRIQRFAPDGTWAAMWGTEGTLGGEMNVPVGIGIDTAGNVYVADSGNQRVQKFVDFAEPAPPAPPDDDGDPAGGGAPADGDPAGPGPAPPGPAPPGLAPPGAVLVRDVVAPRIVSVAIDSAFAATARPRALAAQRRRRGATIAISVDESSSLALRVQRARRGRRRGARCVAPALAPRGRRCTRFVTRGTLRHQVRAGVTRLRFSGWIGQRRLRPGRYRLLVTATDAAGNRSTPRASNRFRVVRPRR